MGKKQKPPSAELILKDAEKLKASLKNKKTKISHMKKSRLKNSSLRFLFSSKLFRE